MTTIAWDGHTLAVDKGLWDAGVRVQGDKICVLTLTEPSVWGDEGDKIIVAFQGDALTNDLVAQALKQGNAADVSTLVGGDPRRVVAVVVDKNREVFDWHACGLRAQNGCVRMSHFAVRDVSMADSLPDSHSQWNPDYFTASGSGAHFAYGALAMGATAERAIELTIMHTDFAAIGVDKVEWSDVFGTPPPHLAPQSPDDDIPF